MGDAAAFGIPNDDWGEEVKVVIEPAQNVEASDALRDDILDFCRDRLAKYKTPKSIDFIVEMAKVTDRVVTIDELMADPDDDAEAAKASEKEPETKPKKGRRRKTTGKPEESEGSGDDA